MNTFDWQARRRHKEATFKMALLMVMLALVPGEMFDPMPQGEGIDEGNIIDEDSIPCRGCGIKGTSAGGCWDCCPDDLPRINYELLCLRCDGPGIVSSWPGAFRPRFVSFHETHPGNARRI